MTYYKPGTYVAIIPTGQFDGHIIRTFEYPGDSNGAAWYFLNRIDHESALELVLPLEAFSHLLHEPLIVQCAWCKKRIRINGVWYDINETIWNMNKVTHGICPFCHEHINPQKG